MSRSLWLGALFSVVGCFKSNPAYDLPGSTGGTEMTGTPGTTGTPGSEPTAGTDPTSSGGCQADEDCADALFCNGAEICDPGAADADLAGCVPGAAPCDGAMICQERGALCQTACEADDDADDDGVAGMACGGKDCDDADPGVFPGQVEVCDAAGVDEDCDPATLGGTDADNDSKISNLCCNLDHDNVLRCGDDCDDSLPGLGVGDWAHCQGCGMSCGAQQTCEAGACIGARRVFATSKTFKADLGGLAGADAACQAHADAAALGGVFKAYMVDDDTNLDRLEHPQVPFVRLDGVKIADDWADLADESLDAPLAVDEFRQPAEGNAWTGLRDVGGGGVSSCNDWTFAGGDCLQNNICGGAGESSMVDDHWDGFFIFDCSEKFRLYCIEQS